MTSEATAPLKPVTESALNTDISSEGNPKRLHRIPTFASRLEEQGWQKEQMAAAFRIFAKLGFADGASGHISLRGRSHLRPINVSSHPSLIWLWPLDSLTSTRCTYQELYCCVWWCAYGDN
jgi:hypothetical protein